MRTVFLTLLFLLAFTMTAPAQEPAPKQPDVKEDAAKEGTAKEGDKSIVTKDIQIGPFGEARMSDDTGLEIAELQKIGDLYWIYIAGKLNGRASTVISLTRMEDLKKWAVVLFNSPNDFTIISKSQKKWHFTEARMYLGSDSATHYSFYITNPNTFNKELFTVEKDKIKGFAIK